MKKMQQILVEVRQKLAEEIAVTDEDEIKQLLKHFLSPEDQPTQLL